MVVCRQCVPLPWPESLFLFYSGSRLLQPAPCCSSRASRSSLVGVPMLPDSVPRHPLADSPIGRRTASHGLSTLPESLLHLLHSQPSAGPCAVFGVLLLLPFLPHHALRHSTSNCALTISFSLPLSRCISPIVQSIAPKRQLLT